MARDYTLSDDFELQGYWWLPEKDDRKVPGTLIRKDQEVSLHLLDTLVERSLQEFGVVGPPPRPAMILGALADGRACTLYKNFEDGVTLTSSGFQTSRFSSRMLFLGKHFRTENELTFSLMSATHTHTEEWLMYKPFEAKLGDSDGKQVTAQALYISFPAQTFPVPAINASVTLESVLRGSSSLRHHEWHHSVEVKVAFGAEQNLNRYLEVLTDCRNLLTLFVGDPVQARTLIGYRDRPPVDGHQPDPEAVDVFFGQRSLPRREDIHFTDIIVPYPSVQHLIGDVFANWLTKADQLRTVAELYFGSLYNKGMYLRFHLLSLAQALECYSRIRLHPRDNKGFKARVEELLATLRPSASNLICQDAAYFAEVLVDTRDYLTHYLEKHRTKAPEGADLYMLTQLAWLLLTVLLLKEVGLDEPLIEALIRQHPRLMQWLTPHPARPTAPG